MITMRILFIVLRLGMAVAIIAAVVGQLFTSTSFWNDLGIVDTWILYVNFFSFFTIESNILAIVVGILGAGLLIAGRGRDPLWFAVFRAATATYMITTGVVYNLLLRGIELPQGTTLGWSNEILHVVGPLLWLFAPGRRPLGVGRIWYIVVFPVVWALYTLIRGPFTPDIVFGRDTWYPYPFLNPDTSANGYLSVSFYIVLITLVIGLTAAGVLWVSRRGAVRREDIPGDPQRK
jgi:hypothetical protein